jgi:ATP-dependent helicase/nuclease subunit A
MKVRLNAEQAKAAMQLDSPVLVTAGAGSGKTRMLTERFVNAVLPGAVNGWVPAQIDQIVAITFAEKAAGEIAARVRLELRSSMGPEAARGVGDAWISTIHGLCSRLLRRHAFDAGVDPRFVVADALRSGALREKAFEDAARELMELDVQARTLFETYPFDDLYAATRSITRELAVAGMGPNKIALEPFRANEGLRRDVEQLLSRGTQTCNLGYSGTSTAPADHAQTCRELLERCGSIASVLSEREILEGLLEVVSAYKPLRRLKGLEDVALELAEQRLQLQGEIASALVAPSGRALKKLTEQYALRYSQAKATAGVLDFDDLQVLTVNLLEAHPELAKRYRERFRVVMIDEFQDTDALQLRLVEVLSNANLCTVGDEKQSIYRFRGADIDVYRRHQRSMEAQGATVVKLCVNYRSHPDILGFVNGVFSAEEYFGQSLLRLTAPDDRPHEEAGASPFGNGPRVEAVFVDSTEVDSTVARQCEAATIALRLAELHASGVPSGDMAILLRRYRYAHVFAEELGRVGLRAVVIGGSRFFALPEIAVMRALTRVIANVLDGAALGHLLSGDFIPLAPDAIVQMRFATGARDARPLWELLVEHGQTLPGADGDAIRRLVEVVQRARGRAGREPLGDVLLKAVEEAGWDLRLLAGGNMGRDAFSNVLKFARQAATFEASSGLGAAGFVSHLDTRERLGDHETPASLADDGSDAVRIMSIHASKGLEFPVVVVPELSGGRGGGTPRVRIRRSDEHLEVALRLPALSEAQKGGTNTTWGAEFSSQDAESAAEEDARVLYVAFTRAREMLVLSGSMGLKPKSGTTAKTDLVRLARMLGVGIPVAGESDQVISHFAGVDCRVRVIEACAQAEPGRAERLARSDASPPEFGESLGRWDQRQQLPRRLSYTQLSEFEHCPRRFWARRVLGLRSVRFQESGHTDPLRFGTALHACLRLVGPGTKPPAEARIDAISRFHELDAPETRRLRDAVARYCGSDIATRTAHADSLRRETPFVLPIGGLFRLAGATDLFARTGDSAIVVDYKSGETGEATDLELRYRLQADCYALAALRDGCASVHVEFVRPEVSDEAGRMQRVSFDYVAANAETIEADLERRYREIEVSAFEPTPSWEECAFCDVPEGLCEERARSSERTRAANKL